MGLGSIASGLIKGVFGGGKGPLVVGVEDQLDTGEWGLVATGIGVMVFLCSIAYFIVKWANYLFAAK